MYDVSRITAKRALNELANAKYVVRQRGKGTRVLAQLPDAPLEIPAEDLTESKYQMGSTPMLRSWSLPMSPRPPTWPSIWRAPRAISCRWRCGFAATRAGPSRTWSPTCPRQSAARTPGTIWASTPLFQLIEQSGIKLTSARHTVNAVLADPVVAPLLGVDIASPLLSVNELVFDQTTGPWSMSLRYTGQTVSTTASTWPCPKNGDLPSR